MKPFAFALVLAAAVIGFPAFADEIIVTHPVQATAVEAPAAPPIADPELAQRKANGDWARRVMAGARGEEDIRDEAPRGCQRNPDRSPHGEVWVGVGTGGYNSAGAAVTAPIGDCGEATVAVSHTDWGRSGRGRRR
jgi:hypothetical protein